MGKLSQNEAIGRLKSGKFTFDPFSVSVKDTEVQNSLEAQKSVDAVLEITWNNSTKIFVSEFLQASTPKALQSKVPFIKEVAESLKTFVPESSPTPRPLILTPYLNEDALSFLREQNVSGLDFSGNGLLIVPDEWFVLKSGKENQFPASQGIKNIYRGKTSLVPRAFVEQSSFETVTGIKETIDSLGGSLSLSAVSKALQSLEEDFIVDRNGSIQLINPEKLLKNLDENYRLPEVENKKRGQIVSDNPLEDLKWSAESQELDLVGITPNQFGIRSNVEEIGPIYTSSTTSLLQDVNFKEKPRFAEFEIRQTSDPRIYFASKSFADPEAFSTEFPWASPLECYLQLSQGDKRQQEQAQKIKSKLLDNLKESK